VSKSVYRPSTTTPAITGMARFSPVIR